MMTIEERAFKAYPIDEEFRKGFEDLKENGVHNICVYDSFSKERYGYIKACKEYESLPKIRGWVARDSVEDGFCGTGLVLHYSKPTRSGGEWSSMTIAMHLPSKMFPEITWESEPVEVELLIRRV